MRILFITATRIGDAVLSTGVLNELHRRHPHAAITVVCGPLAVSLFRRFPGVVDVIALAKRPFAAHWVSLWQQVWQVRWDLVVDLRRSLIPYFVRAARRHSLGPTDPTRHRAEFLPTVLGIDHALEPVIPGLAVDNSATADLIAIAPMAARADKTWPIDRFVELARRLLAGPCPGLRVGVIAGPNEDYAVAPFTALGSDQIVPMIGNPDLLEVVAVLAKCRLFVGNDSGISHLAAAVGAPTLALFGPTEPANYAPRGPCSRVARAPRRNGLPTMADLTIDAVMAAAMEVVALSPGARYWRAQSQIYVAKP